MASAELIELPSPASRRYWAYPVLVGLPALGLAAILIGGDSLVDAPAAAAVAGQATKSVNATLRLPVFLAQIVVALVLSRLVGRSPRALGQPQVIGEMVAGLLLGPSVLGWIAPDVYGMLFPAGTVRFLNAVSQVGLLLYMFLVGLELDPKAFRGRGHVALLTSHVSMVTPMFLGAALSLVLYPRLSTSSVSFPAFALFVGTALSVTAFPVLARLLAEHRLASTALGRIAIACAAIDDVTAWFVLAAITSFTGAREAHSALWLSVAGVVVFTAAMFTVVGPLLRWIVQRAQRDGALGHDALAAIIAIVFGAAWTTDLLGVHALFGAFMAGVVMPKERAVAESIRHRSEDLLLVLLLPLFFVATGIRTDISLLRGAAPLLALTILAAVAGKLGGSAIAARAMGMPWRESAALGSLLNARGLIGLVIINVGLEMRIISPAVYTILVLTAVATTLMASPMLAWLYPRDGQGAAPIQDGQPRAVLHAGPGQSRR